MTNDITQASNEELIEHIRCPRRGYTPAGVSDSAG